MKRRERLIEKSREEKRKEKKRWEAMGREEKKEERDEEKRWEAMGGEEMRREEIREIKRWKERPVCNWTKQFTSQKDNCQLSTYKTKTNGITTRDWRQSTDRKISGTLLFTPAWKLLCYRSMLFLLWRHRPGGACLRSLLVLLVTWVVVIRATASELLR